MPRLRFTRRELHYLRMIYIALKFFPKILVKVFKKEWKKWTALTWNDDRDSGSEFWARESSENKERNKEKERTIKRGGDSSRFDCTVLFYLILNSDSVGQNLWKYDRGIHSQINKLRKLRNEVVHRSKIEVSTKDFETFLAQVRKSFRNLGFGTDDINDIETMNFFDEEIVDDLKKKLEREKQKLRRYKEYFKWRNFHFEEFSRKYNKQSITTKDLRQKGILTDQDVDKLERQKDEKLKNAMLVDCILYKGQTATSAFLDTVHQTDAGLAESFASTLPHNNLSSVTIFSPESTDKPSCQYPKNYEAIMLEFTRYIYSMDWERMDQRGKLFLEQSEDWSEKLFVMIELAYGYNVRGESETAIRLLDEVTQNASKAGPNSVRIISRAYSRKSLHYIHVLHIEKAEFFATEAITLISSIKSPEEEIVGLKRLADSILYGEGSVEERRTKLTPIYNKIIELCRVHIDDIPRCTDYLRFVYNDMARLCLGFTRHGFIETTLDELEEGEKHLKRLEEDDLKTTEGDTYIDAFISICKSIAASKRRKLTKNEQEIKKLRKKSSKFKDKARKICEALKDRKNSGLMFMMELLDKYKTDLQEK